jgi:mono/diheme cytochrome c family protein
LWLAPAWLGLTLLSGCDTEYPSDLKYGLRTDPLPLTRVDTVPARIDKPGEFPNLLHYLEPKDRQKVVNPGTLSEAVRRKLEDSLERHFGTPRKPTVTVKDLEDDSDKPKFKVGDKTQVLQNYADFKTALKLDDATLEQGSVAYRLNCLHCHGLTGNGRGPTAPWVNPHPRDYRQGKFKFISIKGGNERKPTRADLLRTLREGVEGTSMPSFGLLPENELEALVSYVIHLSLRGQVEFNQLSNYLQEGADTADVEGDVNKNLWDVSAPWWAATFSGNWLVPAEPPAVHLPPREEDRMRVQNGYNLFRSTAAAGCIGCHRDYGRQAAYFFDDWGTIGRPADLTQGVYRGGRRPIDFFWRIRSGVNGSNMPAFPDDVLKTQEVWDLISFLQVLPNPTMRKAFDIRID